MEDKLGLIAELNEELYDSHGDVEYQFFYTSSGYVEILGFGDIVLWCSENEERVWREKTNDYEPMKPFLKKRLKQIGRSLIDYSK